MLTGLLIAWAGAVPILTHLNAAAPGIIKSPMNPVDTYAQLDALHPVGHMGEISDIVGAILYLESAPFVTGEILHIDGGQSAGH